MMIERVFLVHNIVYINEVTEALEFEKTGHVVPNKARLSNVPNRLSMVSSKTHIIIVDDGRKTGNQIKTYAVTLADVDKTLALKKIVDPSKHIPDLLGSEYLVNFLAEEANRLLIH